MATTTVPPLTSAGREVDTRPEAFGSLRESMDVVDDAAALRERMAEDGYLYLPGYLDRTAVLEARAGVTEALAEEGVLHPHRPALDAVAAPDPPKRESGVRDDIARRVPALQRLLFAGRMTELYRRLLGGDIMYFNYTWLRARGARGGATPPHYDIVFMGRGTPNIRTAWTPLGDVSYELGGLMMLEGSHRLQRLRDTYARRDVDSYCLNKPSGEKYASREKRWNGALAKDPVKLREQLGGRWLTAEFRAGDLLTFGMFTLHASLDNHTDRVRISCDSRYQLASEPADERWVGEEPIGHATAGIRGRIC